VCEDTPKATIQLPGSLKASHVARGFLTETRCHAHQLVAMDDALLAMSEAVTNAVVHGGPPVQLAIECIEYAAEIRVRDGGGGSPHKQDASLDATHGRGLLLIDALADSWGVAPIRPFGKEIWFRIQH
jgi:anti-sigma regulatory factor (Ser/Thr protein kinase)